MTRHSQTEKALEEGTQCLQGCKSIPQEKNKRKRYLLLSSIYKQKGKESSLSFGEHIRRGRSRQILRPVNQASFNLSPSLILKAFEQRVEMILFLFVFVLYSFFFFPKLKYSQMTREGGRMRNRIHF